MSDIIIRLHDKVKILSGKHVGEIGTVHGIPQKFFDYLIKLSSGDIKKIAREDFEVIESASIK